MGSSPAGLLFPYLPCVYPEVGVQRGWVCALGLGHLLYLDTVEWGWGTGKTRPNFADLLRLLCMGSQSGLWRPGLEGKGNRVRFHPSFHSTAQLGALLFCFANRVRFFSPGHYHVQACARRMLGSRGFRPHFLLRRQHLLRMHPPIVLFGHLVSPHTLNLCSCKHPEVRQIRVPNPVWFKSS